MGLMLRLVTAILRGFTRPPIRSLAPMESRFRVGLLEAGRSLLFSERYVGYTEVARTELMIRAGFLGVMLRKKWTPVVASELVRFKKPVRRFQVLRLSTRVLGWDERYIYFEHVFHRGAELAALVIATGTIRSKDGVVAPAQFAAELPWALGPSPLLPDWIRLWSEAEERAMADAGRPAA